LDAPRSGIDLRSDTVTRPSPGMRAAMAAAEVGDDVFGDDPTVNRLQASIAERFGFEGALFFVSGTQSNLAALMAHCGRGEEYLVGQEAHAYSYEQGGAAVLGSIQPQPLENEADGGISIERIAKAIKPDDIHFAPTRLLALENTISGRVLPPAYLRQVTQFAHGQGLRTHLDGARIFNAIVKLGSSERAAVAGFDSVSVCLSKGLGAPAGSVLLAFAETRWVAPGGSKNDCPTLKISTGPPPSCERISPLVTKAVTEPAWRAIKYATCPPPVPRSRARAGRTPLTTTSKASRSGPRA